MLDSVQSFMRARGSKIAARGGIVPGTGAVAALVSAATGIKPYYIGKPNPLMMRTALRSLNAHSEDSVMIGDRMNTDIVAGLERLCLKSQADSHSAWYSRKEEVKGKGIS